VTFSMYPPHSSAAAPRRSWPVQSANTGQATLEDGQDKSQSPHDSTRARSRRARSHAASFAISIAAHAIAITAILYFAPAISKPHSDFVFAYLVDVRDGSSGRSMRAGAAATLTTPIRSDAGPMLLSTTRRKPQHPRIHRRASAVPIASTKQKLPS